MESLQMGSEKQDRRALSQTRGEDARIVARLHEAEQRRALADRKEHERGRGGAIARSATAAPPRRAPTRRSSGARSPSPIAVAPAKFKTNSVPIVGIAEWIWLYSCRCMAPTASNAAAPKRSSASLPKLGSPGRRWRAGRGNPRTGRG
jgi:hypothetical protein